MIPRGVVPGDPVLALDPGLRNPAAAFFFGGRLQAASRIKVPAKMHKLPVGERCRQVGLLVAEWFAERSPEPPCALVIEWPQVYRAGKSKGDPNDLVPLAGLGMMVAGLLVTAAVISPTPREWIGGIPKNTTGDPLASPRGAMIWRLLDVVEREGVVLSHDAIDAIGLGLYVHDRLDVSSRRVFPGAV